MSIFLSANDRSMALKIRIRAGILAPDWAKHLGGDPVPISHRGQSGTVPRFWTPDFGRAYDELVEGVDAAGRLVREREIGGEG